MTNTQRSNMSIDNKSIVSVEKQEGGSETGCGIPSDPTRHTHIHKTLFDLDVFRLFVHPGEVVEVRALNVDNKNKFTLSGYFDDHEAFVREIRALDKKPHSGIYFTPQVIDPRLIGRAYNRIRPIDVTTADKDVLAYRWLLIDIDPARPAGIPSSDSELQAALNLRNPIIDWVMREVNLKAPIQAMSGNGAHLLFPMPYDLPATKQTTEWVKTILNDLHKAFSNEIVKIDTSVYNPARIWKLYGTLAKKGDEIPENQYREARSHRVAYIDDLGGAI